MIAKWSNIDFQTQHSEMKTQQAYIKSPLLAYSNVTIATITETSNRDPLLATS